MIHAAVVHPAVVHPAVIHTSAREVVGPSRYTVMS